MAEEKAEHTVMVPWHTIPNSSKLWLPKLDVVSLIALDRFLFP